MPCWLWALLPLVVSRESRLGSLGYAVLLGFIGLGAVLGASFLPRVRRHLRVDALVALATLAFASAMIALLILGLQEVLWLPPLFPTFCVIQLHYPAPF